MTPVRDPRQQSPLAQRDTAWPVWLRRGALETSATGLIAIGILMLLQPFSLTLYGWSFVTTLAGVAMFTIVSKFPE